MSVRDHVAQMACDQATDAEIEAALSVLGEARMTPEEIHSARELRLAGRAEMRGAIADAVREPPEVAKARRLLDVVLEQVKAKLEAGDYLGTELVRVGKWLSSIALLPRQSATNTAMELGRQYLGFTAKGYDDELRTEAEKAEMMAAAEREEAARREREKGLH